MAAPAALLVLDLVGLVLPVAGDADVGGDQPVAVVVGVALVEEPEDAVLAGREVHPERLDGAEVAVLVDGEVGAVVGDPGRIGDRLAAGVDPDAADGDDRPEQDEAEHPPQELLHDRRLSARGPPMG